MAGLRKGYPGLTHTAEKIAKFIGSTDVFVEPFAGLGRVSKYIDANKIVLNDMSDFAYTYLKNNFTEAEVTKKDFIECVNLWNVPNATMFFDPPWSRVDYAENPKTYCDRGVGEYYKELRNIVETLQGDFYIAGRANGGSRSTVSVYFKDFPFVVIESDRKINGYPIKTKVYYSKK